LYAALWRGLFWISGIAIEGLFGRKTAGVRYDVHESGRIVKHSFLVHLVVALLLTPPESGKGQIAAGHEDASPPLRVDSAFVWVPALTKNEKGETVKVADASHLRLLDNGNPEKAIRIDTDGLPVSLVILMQTGGSAKRFLASYANLPWLINRWVGDSTHEITLVTFDSRIKQIWHFPTRADGAIYAMTHQQPGDDGAAIKDAVAFGVRQLQAEPGRFRRIVLLLSQAEDKGSSTDPKSLLEQLGTSSTVIYSLTFPEREKLSRLRKEDRSDSIAQALARTTDALEYRTAPEAADLTGGSDHEFDDQSSFNSAMLETLSDFRRGVTLGFQPSRPLAGFHRIEVKADSSGVRITARRAYWSVPSK